ncbi:hypothetical protein [Nostoc sp.]|uniref:hypothetical protein n=1 Tax=Nostoc sp. TaxID=1180 RepID=UPI0035937F77
MNITKWRKREFFILNNASNKGFTRTEINRIQKLIQEHQEHLVGVQCDRLLS